MHGCALESTCLIWSRHHKPQLVDRSRLTFSATLLWEEKESWMVYIPSFCFVFMYNMDRVKRICYLSPMWAAKVQASLRICAVSPEPSLLAHTSSESRGIFRQKSDPWSLWMAGHAQLKFVMTECSKIQIRLTRPILYLFKFMIVAFLEHPHKYKTNRSIQGNIFVNMA